ncbi:MAG: hypothetical protein OXF88_05285 [Rhodobacteraceae bacterium]|nr:hypothetical protein [Paracoccaceae bacterium]MCY4138418.1 hypothetical protein [Paracoccaceae bacterium]
MAETAGSVTEDQVPAQESLAIPGGRAFDPERVIGVTEPARLSDVQAGGEFSGRKV